MGPGTWRRSVEHQIGRRITRSERRCIGKAPMTQLRAEMIAERLRRTRNSRYAAYPCPFCQHWHVGRRKAVA